MCSMAIMNEKKFHTNVSSSNTFCVTWVLDIQKAFAFLLYFMLKMCKATGYVDHDIICIGLLVLLQN